jgi:HEPN domain-containing protein
MAGSSPSPEALEVAELLAWRASGDLKVARKLAPDPEIDESAIGFHAQQAIEKALKVALILTGVDFPKTHDLDFLVGLASRQTIDVPETVASAGWLTPWGTDFRYDDEPLHSLDRGGAVELAGCAVAWCEELLIEAQNDEASGGPDTPA